MVFAFVGVFVLGLAAGWLLRMKFGAKGDAALSEINKL